MVGGSLDRGSGWWVDPWIEVVGVSLGIIEVEWIPS